MEDASHRHSSRTTMHCWNTQWLCKPTEQRTRLTRRCQRLDPLVPLTRTLWTASLSRLSMVSYIFPSAPSPWMESGFLTRTNSESKELLPDLAGLSLSNSSKLSQTVLLSPKPPQVHGMAGSDSSPCAGQKSSRPVLRVNTSIAAPVTQSGQNGDPISVSSSPSSSPTLIAVAQPAATAAQNQVSSSMAPPPRPVVNGTWIQPFRLPVDAPPIDPRANLRTRRALKNSGVSVMTEYPLSTSPRATKEDANRTLNEVAAQHDYMFRPCTRMTPGAVVADSKTNYKGNAHLTQKVVVANPDFQSFSWDSTVQPRTAAARAHGLQGDVSPGTKEQDNVLPAARESSNKRKHPEGSEEQGGARKKR
jgi:hypothetical protein